MNDEMLLDAPDTFTEKAVPLLVEYHQKFNTIHERLKGFADKATYEKMYFPGRDTAVQAEVAAIEEWYKRVEPAARRLAQDVSGMIDQGRLTPLERTELQLRLAEFEAALITLPKLLAVYRK